MSASNKAIVRPLYDEVWNKRRVSRLIAAFPDLRFTIEDIVGENEKLAVSWTISGTHKGEFMGVPATNKKVSVDGITINHIVNAKIMDSYISWDALGMMQQLGVVPALGQTKTLTAR